MRRISSSRLLALATLLALALTLLVGGIASASTVAASQQVSSTTPICILATPLSQIVGVKQIARVKVTVNCLPATATAYVRAKWGDGTIKYYPIVRCVEVCHVPPFIVNTSHVYLSVGLYHPIFCVIPLPSPVTTSLTCTTVRIQVVSLDPPVA